MRTAIIGSRSLIDVEISKYVPDGTDMIITGGARGIDTLAEKYADENKIFKLIIKPDYETYGRRAPLLRNKTIVEKADIIIALWDGKSRGTRFTIDYAKKCGKKVKIYIFDENR